MIMLEYALRYTGINQKTLAKYLGVTKNCVYSWLKKKTKIQDKYEKKLEKLFIFTPKFLMSKVNDENISNFKWFMNNHLDNTDVLNLSSDDSEYKKDLNNCKNSKRDYDLEDTIERQIGVLRRQMYYSLYGEIPDDLHEFNPSEENLGKFFKANGLVTQFCNFINSVNHEGNRCYGETLLMFFTAFKIVVENDYIAKGVYADEVYEFCDIIKKILNNYSEVSEDE